jgi:hypothetical protein
VTVQSYFSNTYKLPRIPGWKTAEAVTGAEGGTGLDAAMETQVELVILVDCGGVALLETTTVAK